MIGIAKKKKKNNKKNKKKKQTKDVPSAVGKGMAGGLVMKDFWE